MLLFLVSPFYFSYDLESDRPNLFPFFAAFQNRPEMPAMERIYRQIILSNKELACAGNGKASLINIEDYCARDMETGFSKALYSDPMIL